MGEYFAVHMGGVLEWSRYASSSLIRAANRAGTDALRGARAEASRQIRAKKSLKVSHMDDALTTFYPSTKETLLWRLQASGAAMPVAAYPHRQTKLGVLVAINVGNRSRIPHAFMATMKSGHAGVFARYGQPSIRPIQGYKGHARYAGQKRQPIRELYTTRVSDAFRDALDAIANVARERFARSLERNLRSTG